jgi:hypothetical protein
MMVQDNFLFFYQSTVDYLRKKDILDILGDCPPNIIGMNASAPEGTPRGGLSD